MNANSTATVASPSPRLRRAVATARWGHGEPTVRASCSDSSNPFGRSGVASIDAVSPQSIAEGRWFDPTPATKGVILHSADARVVNRSYHGRRAPSMGCGSCESASVAITQCCPYEVGS
jgi:hypothetical protein